MSLTCPPCKTSRPLGTIQGANCPCLQPPADTTALLAELQQEFSADDLIAARVVVPADDGVRLHAGLTDPESIFVGVAPQPVAGAS